MKRSSSAGWWLAALGLLLAPALLGTDQVRCVPAPSLPACIEEGERFLADDPAGPECCDGLEAVPDSWFDEALGRCDSDRTQRVCTAYGDGICGIAENLCNAPWDCHDHCCALDGECNGENLICLDGYCVGTAQEGRCWRDGDCPAGYSCAGAAICPCPALCEEVLDPEGYCVWDRADGDVCAPADLPYLSLATDAVGPSTGTVYWTKTDPHDPNRLFVSANNELYRSVNGGGNWWIQRIDLQHNGVQAIAFHPVFQDTIYLGIGYYGDSTLLRTDDDGWTWTVLPLPDEALVESLATDPHDPERLLVGTHWRGVYESTDGGATFDATGYNQGNALHLLVDPTNGDRLYVGAWGSGGFHRSFDGGATWLSDTAPGTTLADLVMDPSDPATLYAVVYGAGQFWDTVYRSRDRGATWTNIYDDDLGGRGIFGLHVDRCDPDRILLGARNAVVLSEDGGATWTHRPSGFFATSNVVIYGFGWTPNRLFAGGEICGLYESLDHGRTWHHLAGLVCDNAPDIDL